MSALADIRYVISRNRSRSVRRARRSRIVTAGALALTLGLAAPNAPSVAATRQVPGSPGAGDYYFPAYGNGGYDVRHYDIAVRFDTNTERLRGTTTIAMVPTVSNLERFNLDLVLRATEVRADGVVAGIRQTSRELVVTPARPLRRGRAATVVVKYAGTPRNTTVDGLKPWITTLDGAVALGEPEIAAWWFPSNDHPIDKATFDIDITVPAGKEAISNGRLMGSTTNDGWTRWSWELRSLSTTYLVFAAIGDYRIEQGTSKGLPYLYAFGLLADTPASPRLDPLHRSSDAVPRDEVGAVPVQPRRRRGAERRQHRLRAGNPDPSRVRLALLLRVEPQRRDPRDGAPVVR
ncbi:MAG: hypothetical protein WKF58_10620 [Ilumatobacteraceae bacterium]